MKLIKCRKCGRYFQVTDNDYCLSKCTGCGSTDLEETIYKPMNDSNIDWEQRRYEIAKSAMNGKLADHTAMSKLWQCSCEDVSTFHRFIAEASVELADALIAELKKTNETK